MYYAQRPQADATALVHEDVQLTYRELHERANQLAHELRHEECIAPGLARSVELIAGVLKAGGAHVHASEDTATS